jgi:enoyl-CoA hydratase/carnithine racemase
VAYEDLRVEIADGVALLTLDRPAERNAFSGAMGASLAAAYRECDGRDDVVAILERRAPRWALAVPRDWPEKG